MIALSFSTPSSSLRAYSVLLLNTAVCDLGAASVCFMLVMRYTLTNNYVIFCIIDIVFSSQTVVVTEQYKSTAHLCVCSMVPARFSEELSTAMLLFVRNLSTNSDSEQKKKLHRPMIKVPFFLWFQFKRIVKWCREERFARNRSLASNENFFSLISFQPHTSAYSCIPICSCYYLSYFDSGSWDATPFLLLPSRKCVVAVHRCHSVSSACVSDSSKWAAGRSLLLRTSESKLNEYFDSKVIWKWLGGWQKHNGKTLTRPYRR